MKKKEKKLSDKRISQYDANLGDLGLEPPKIYRESQKKIMSQSNDKRGNRSQNMTTHEKRQAQSRKRKKKNKLRKMLIWVVLIVLLVATAVVLSLTVFFHIQNITIEGNDRYSQEDISTHLTVDVGENLFLADTKSASARLEQSLPYIYNAEIKRKLPSTINVTITECEPSFYIITKDKTIVLLDKDFKVLETEADKQKGIRINSAKVTSAVAGQKIVFEDEAVGECLEKLASTIIDNDFEKITSIYSNNISDNYVVYDGRIKFKLGTCENLEGKMFQAFASCDDLNRTSPNAKGTLTVNGGKQIYFTEE